MSDEESTWGPLPTAVWLVRYRWEESYSGSHAHIQKTFTRRGDAENELIDAWKDHDDLYDVEVWVLEPCTEQSPSNFLHWHQREWREPVTGGIR